MSYWHKTINRKIYFLRIPLSPWVWVFLSCCWCQIFCRPLFVKSVKTWTLQSIGWDQRTLNALQFNLSPISLFSIVMILLVGSQFLYSPFHTLLATTGPESHVVPPNTKIQKFYSWCLYMPDAFNHCHISTYLSPAFCSFTITDMYGCPMELKTGSEYYIFASFERHINSVDPISLVMDFAVDPNNNETSANFIQRLKAIKEEPPQCEPLPAK